MNERERIELLMKCYELSPSQFADRTGIQRASVSHILSGRNKPSLEIMQKICESFPQLDAKWLMLGVGEEPGKAESVETSASPVENTLFPPSEHSLPADVQPAPALHSSIRPVIAQQPEVKPVQTPVVKAPVERLPRKPQQRASVVQQMAAVQGKKIKELRVYYTDGTYETLVPEK